MNKSLIDKLKEKGDLVPLKRYTDEPGTGFMVLFEHYAEKYLQAVEYLEAANALSPVDIELIRDSFGHGRPFNNVAEFCRLFPKYLPYEISLLKTRKSKMKTTKVRELIRILNDAKSN